jgi:hypothetical protein
MKISYEVIRQEKYNPVIGGKPKCSCSVPESKNPLPQGRGLELTNLFKGFHIKDLDISTFYLYYAFFLKI